MPRRNEPGDDVNDFLRGYSVGGGRGGGRPTRPGRTSGGGDDRSFLGVPEGYTAYRPDTPARGFTGNTSGLRDAIPYGPRYRDGDEWQPANTSPDSIWGIQQALTEVGLIPFGTSFQRGMWDEPTRSAYKDLLSQANAAGMTYEQMLSQLRTSGGLGNRGYYDENGNWVSDPTSGGGGSGGPETYIPPPLELKTTNKEDLKRAFRNSIIETMGEGWSQEQISEMVDAYNWQEIKVQKDAYDQTVAIERADFEGTRDPAGGEIINQVSVASPDTFLENQLMEKDPVGYQAAGITNDFVPAFFEAIKGYV